jgi:hypothetical protein
MNSVPPMLVALCAKLGKSITPVGGIEGRVTLSDVASQKLTAAAHLDARDDVMANTSRNFTDA